MENGMIEIEKSNNTDESLDNKKTRTFGTTKYIGIRPEESELYQVCKVINIDVTFEEALRLHLAIDECVRQMNSYNMHTFAGRNQKMRMSVFLEKKRIVIGKSKL